MKIQAINLGLTYDNYYENSWEDPVLTSSLLEYLCPAQGGSPARFHMALTDQEEKKHSLSLERGKLMHRYLKDPDNFGVVSGYPGESTAVVIETLLHKITESGITPGESLSDHSNLLIAAAREAGFGGRAKWGDAVIFKKIASDNDGAGEKYFKILRENNGKIIIKPDEYERITHMRASIEKSAERRWLIDEPERDGEILFAKEKIISFMINDRYKCKSALDSLYIDHKLKQVVIRDLKTTRDPVNLYMGGSYLYQASNDMPQRFYTTGPFQRYRTYRQLFMYRLAALTLFPEMSLENYTWNFHVDVVGSEKPYEFRSYQMSLDFLHPYFKEAMRELEDCLDVFNHYCEEYLTTRL